MNTITYKPDWNTFLLVPTLELIYITLDFSTTLTNAGHFAFNTFTEKKVYFECESVIVIVMVKVIMMMKIMKIMMMV